MIIHAFCRGLMTGSFRAPRWIERRLVMLKDWIVGVHARWAVFQAEFRKNNTEIGIGAYEDGKVRLFDFRKSDGLITLRSLPLKVTGACWYPKPNCNIYGYAGRNESGIGDLRGVLPIPIHQHYQPINRLVKWGSGDKDTTDEISSVGPPRLECPPAMSALYDPPLENGREEERRKQRLRDNRRRNRAFAEMFNGGDGGVLDASDNDTPPPQPPMHDARGGAEDCVHIGIHHGLPPPPLPSYSGLSVDELRCSVVTAAQTIRREWLNEYRCSGTSRRTFIRRHTRRTRVDSASDDPIGDILELTDMSDVSSVSVSMPYRCTA
eukprot:GHVO01039151.1.p1 GENE.GHVO01039151.1~~GHVO01039151.1.p1  ORF type:complete len:322 (-),score=41.88 GHVO01039151.1:1119-2084(-)